MSILRRLGKHSTVILGLVVPVSFLSAAAVVSILSRQFTATTWYGVALALAIFLAQSLLSHQQSRLDDRQRALQTALATNELIEKICVVEGHSTRLNRAHLQRIKASAISSSTTLANSGGASQSELAQCIPSRQRRIWAITWDRICFGSKPASITAPSSNVIPDPGRDDQALSEGYDWATYITLDARAALPLCAFGDPKVVKEFFAALALAITVLEQAIFSPREILETAGVIDSRSFELLHDNLDTLLHDFSALPKQADDLKKVVGPSDLSRPGSDLAIAYDQASTALAGCLDRNPLPSPSGSR